MNWTPGTILLAGLGGWMLLLSILAFIAFGVDKRAAIHGKRRTPESRLHLLELLGGWPGAILGGFTFRHKIRKPRYVLVTILVITAWLVAAWFLISATGK